MMFRLSALLLFLLSTSSNNNHYSVVNAQCSVCGENKEVTKGDAIFEFPDQPSVSCGILQIAGESGLVPLNDCQFLPDLLTMCGCAPVGGGGEVEATTPAPVVVPATPEPTTPIPATPEPTADPTTPVPVVVTPDPTPEVVVVPEETAAPVVPETPAPVVVPEPAAVPATTPEEETAPTPKFAPEETVPKTPAPVPEESTPAPYEEEEEEAESTPASDDDDDDDDDSEEETPVQTIPEVTTPDDLTSAMLAGGFYCGQDVADSQTNCDQPCLTNADCDVGNNNFCWGSWNYCSTDPSNPTYNTPPSGKVVIPKPDLPTALEAISDYRCGISEVDARSNCGKLCTTNADCDGDGDQSYCWGTHANYCHLKPEPHPQCDPFRAEQTARRCGGDEASARGFCGKSCNDETDCSVLAGEWCFPVQLNLCACFEEQDDFNALGVALDGQKKIRRELVSVSNRQYFDDAKQPLKRYFLEAYETYEQQKQAAAALRGNNSAAAGIIRNTPAVVVVMMMATAGVAGLVLY